MGTEDAHDLPRGVWRSTRSTPMAFGRVSYARSGFRVVQFDQIDMPAFMPFCSSHLWITASTILRQTESAAIAGGAGPRGLTQDRPAYSGTHQSSSSRPREW